MSKPPSPLQGRLALAHLFRVFDFGDQVPLDFLDGSLRLLSQLMPVRDRAIT